MLPSRFFFAVCLAVVVNCASSRRKVDYNFLQNSLRSILNEASKLKGAKREENENIALNKETKIGDALSAAPEAVDGDKCLEKYEGASTSGKNPFLRINLGSEESVGSVNVFNRRDKWWLRKKMNMFEIRVGNSLVWNKNPVCACGPTMIYEKQTINCRGLKGSYVFLVLPGENRNLYVCEVEVFRFVPPLVSEVGNLALGKKACASSAIWDKAESQYVTDGVKCKYREKDEFKVVQTNREENPWLQVYLEKEFKVGIVKIYNRISRKGYTPPFEIRIGNEAELGKNSVCGCGLYGMDEVISVDCDGLSGKYIFLVSPGAKRMVTICEIEAFEYEVPIKKDPGVDLAAGMPGCLSSEYDWSSKWSAMRQVDDSKSSRSYTGKTDPVSWTYIDLKLSYRIGNVDLYTPNRNKMNPFEIRIGNFKKWEENEQCGCPGDMKMGSEISVNCRGLEGRYVFIVLPKTIKSRILTLHTIKVFEFEEIVENENIALGKQACASSGNPVYITDGEECVDSFKGVKTKKSKDPWVTVDLETNRKIGKVVVYNTIKIWWERDDTPPFEIRVGNDENHAKNNVCGCGLYGMNDFTEVDCDGLEGRYVTLVSPGNNRNLFFCEMKIYKYKIPRPNLEGGNIALNKPTCMSSRFQWTSNGPEFGVDGLTKGHVHSNTKDHIQWFMVDLKLSTNVGKVKIFNRDGYYSYRINPFKIFVGESKAWKENSQCGCGAMTMESELSVTCGGLKGRYVFLVLDRKEKTILNFKEIEIYEHQQNEGPITEGNQNVDGYEVSYGCLIDGFNDKTYENITAVECGNKCNEFDNVIESQGCLSYDYDQLAKTCYMSTRNLKTIPSDHLLYKSAFAHYSKISANGICDIPSNRKDCHAKDEITCKWKGCCWASRSKTGEPRCYHSANSYEVKGILCKEDCDSIFEAFKSDGLSGMMKAFYPVALKEAEYLKEETSAKFWDFIINNDELKENLFATSWPVVPEAIKNMYTLYQNFDEKTITKYAQLFIGTAYQRRKMDVRTHPLYYRTGYWGYLAPNFNFDLDRDYGTSGLTEGQRQLLKDEEDEKAEAADKEQEEQDKKDNEANAGKSGEPETPNINVWERQHETELEQKKFNDMVTALTKTCGVQNAGELRFPPRGVGSNGIEAIKYYLSRDEDFFMFPTLRMPWPLVVSMRLDIPLEECYWVWNRIVTGLGIKTYARYSKDRFKAEFICKESSWNPYSIPRILEDGGICGQLSNLARYNYICAGVPSIQTAQPIHRAGERYSIEYTGQNNLTVSNRTCQAWNSQYPHKHSYGSRGYPENYCRMGKEKKPWCYTTDHKKRWEYCPWYKSMKDVPINEIEFINKMFHSVDSLFHTTTDADYEPSKWNFPPFSVDSKRVMVDYDTALGLAVSYPNLPAWRCGQVALNLFHRLPPKKRIKFEARKLLYAALKESPFSVNLLFILGDELSLKPGEKTYSQTTGKGITHKLPSRCLTLTKEEESEINDLRPIARSWFRRNIPVAHEDYVLRMWANPLCCSPSAKEDILKRIDAAMDLVKVDDSKICKSAGEAFRRLQVVRTACETEAARQLSPDNLRTFMSEIPDSMKLAIDCGDERNIQDFLLLIQKFTTEIDGVSDEDKFNIVNTVCTGLPRVIVSKTTWSVSLSLTECWNVLKKMPTCDKECKDSFDDQAKDLEDRSKGVDVLGFWKPMYNEGKCLGKCDLVVKGNMIWDAEAGAFKKSAGE